ncbi:hypothetical protein RJD24_18780 [Bacillaceae bacterium IKA-2]|nr:hypothetical protein RJD24_18780 [Bacillaceae bacterium IKA-2]
MANSQANRLREAVEAKKKELVEYFKNKGQETLPCGRAIEELVLTELQELQKHGLKNE